MARITKKYLKKKFPGNHAMHEVIDYIPKGKIGSKWFHIEDAAEPDETLGSEGDFALVTFEDKIYIFKKEINAETSAVEWVLVVDLSPWESKQVYQPAHGFSVKKAIRDNGISFVLAQANNAENAQTAGIVTEVIDADNFIYQSGGFFQHPDFLRGVEYFLSPTVAGDVIEEPESWNIGDVRQSLGWGSLHGLKIEIDVGDEIYAETENTGEDAYVDTASVDETAKVTLTRTGGLSDLTVQFGTIALKGFWVGTLESYNAIPVKDENVIYHIEE